mmetsp:Transcript_61448/g.190852  ORF Transcript_61448/g.190852 Transcript_61448/m.190852 type:complete len:279 (-) Transcript_61448:416-1252(-)
MGRPRALCRALEAAPSASSAGLLRTVWCVPALGLATHVSSVSEFMTGEAFISPSTKASVTCACGLCASRARAVPRRASTGGCRRSSLVCTRCQTPRSLLSICTGGVSGSRTPPRSTVMTAPWKGLWPARTKYCGTMKGVAAKAETASSKRGASVKILRATIEKGSPPRRAAWMLRLIHSFLVWYLCSKRVFCCQLQAESRNPPPVKWRRMPVCKPREPRLPGPVMMIFPLDWKFTVTPPASCQLVFPSRSMFRPCTTVPSGMAATMPEQSKPSVKPSS